MSEVKIMKLSKKICVYYEEAEYSIPTKATEFMLWWKKKLDLVPEVYRESVEIDLDTEECYGSSRLNVKVSYYKLETDGEEKKRLEKTAKEALASKVLVEIGERAELKRLQDKYSTKNLGENDE